MIPFFLLAIETTEEREFYSGLWEKYNPLLYYNAYKIVSNEQIAWDMVQTTFENLIKNYKKISAVECCTLPAYLVMCIKRVCFDYLRKNKVHEKHVPYSIDADFGFEYADDIDIAEGVIKALDIKRLMNSLEKLPEKSLDLLKYKYILELHDEEIAEIMGINKNSVRQYLTRARKAALKLLKDEDYE